MTPTPDWETAALAALKVSPSPSARPLFKMAVIIAALGFILVVLSMALYVLFYESWVDQIRNGYPDIEKLNHIARLSSISGYANGVGVVMTVASIVAIIRGLQIQDDLSGSKTALYGALKRAKWVAILSLMLYMLSTVIEIVIGETSHDLSTDASFNASRLIIYSSDAAFVFLAALPLIAAHALNKPRA